MRHEPLDTKQDQRRPDNPKTDKPGSRERFLVDQHTEQELKRGSNILENADQEPLGSNLGKFRILRTSPLTPVPDACCKDCTTYTMNK